MMSTKERKRLVIMQNVIEDMITLKKASELLGISYRQAIRIKKRFASKGAESLVHKSRGKPSSRKMDESFRKKVIELYKKHYEGFGPTFAAEKFDEVNKIKINNETLRLWLIKEGLWTRKRRRRKHRTRRVRKECFGEMIQFDGSPHDWFEGRGEKCCLMNMIDDATNTNYCLFSQEETTEAAMRLLWGWIDKYGIPQSLYCDKKNAYVIFREPTLDEQLKGISEPKTYFGKACEKLGIEIITAHSPQAKGRIERSNGVHQDRLVKELRLAGISTINEANKFIKSKYLNNHNRKFRKKASNKTNVHVDLMRRNDLNNVFCFEHERVVSNDYVIKFENKEYQILKDNRKLPIPKAKVILRKWLDGSIHIFYKNKELKIKEIYFDKVKQVS